MKIAVFGSTGQVGSEVVTQGLALGHEVRAFARRAEGLPAGAVKVIGPIDDEAAVERAIAGADAVINALGPRSNTPDQVELFRDAMLRLTRIMTAKDVQRLVSIAGAGLWIDGDSSDFVRSMITGIMKVVARNVLASKQAEWEVIRRSQLQWTIIRPGRITPGSKTGMVAASLKAPPRNQVTAGDVADFMLRAAGSPEWVHKAPFIG